MPKYIRKFCIDYVTCQQSKSEKHTRSIQNVVLISLLFNLVHIEMVERLSSACSDSHPYLKPDKYLVTSIDSSNKPSTEITA